MLSLKPEPTVVCCNGVCNARILSIVSVPNLPTSSKTTVASGAGHWGGGVADWTEWAGTAAGWSTPDSSNIDWSSASARECGGKYKAWIGSDAGTADSSPQSGNAGHLDIEDEDVTSDEDEDDIVAHTRKQNFINLEQESSSNTPQVRNTYFTSQ